MRDRMTRRHPTHDYTAPGSYMITFSRPNGNNFPFCSVLDWLRFPMPLKRHTGKIAPEIKRIILFPEFKLPCKPRHIQNPQEKTRSSDPIYTSTTAGP